MKVTDFTRSALGMRRSRRELTGAGYFEVSENGDPLWKLHRGSWTDRHITHVAIGPDGKSVWIKVSSPMREA